MKAERIIKIIIESYIYITDIYKLLRLRTSVPLICDTSFQLELPNDLLYRCYNVFYSSTGYVVHSSKDTINFLVTLIDLVPREDYLFNSSNLLRYPTVLKTWSNLERLAPDYSKMVKCRKGQ